MNYVLEYIAPLWGFRKDLPNQESFCLGLVTQALRAALFPSVHGTHLQAQPGALLPRQTHSRHLSSRVSPLPPPGVQTGRLAALSPPPGLCLGRPHLLRSHRSHQQDVLPQDYLASQDGKPLCPVAHQAGPWAHSQSWAGTHGVQNPGPPHRREEITPTSPALSVSPKSLNLIWKQLGGSS